MSETPEPSGPARRAAEAINAMLCDQGHCRAEAYPVLATPLAAIIERETGAGGAVSIIEKLVRWQNFTASEFRLSCGELSAQDIRNIKAVINAIAGEEARTFLALHP